MELHLDNIYVDIELNNKNNKNTCHHTSSFNIALSLKLLDNGQVKAFLKETIGHGFFDIIHAL